jgi:hypothetical protein
VWKRTLAFCCAWGLNGNLLAFEHAADDHHVYLFAGAVAGDDADGALLLLVLNGCFALWQLPQVLLFLLLFSWTRPFIHLLVNAC